MKNYLKTIAAVAMAFTLSTGVVDASTATRKIDSSTCDTVYTNYYFFLDAMTTEFFTSAPLNTLTHHTIAEYYTNSYQTNNIDSNNIGYGQVNISKNSTTSSDGITSMSLSTYYDFYLKSWKTNGAFTEGSKNYIVAHDWYTLLSNGNYQAKTGGLQLGGYSKNSLMNATLSANTEITRLSSVVNGQENPFRLKIDRYYTGSLTGSPISYNSKNYYLHPAVYYIQYCSPKAKENTKYTVKYDGNASNVTNVPDTQTGYDNECVRISSVTPQREGYKFIGWSLNPNATKEDPDFRANSEYCGTRGDITLYAIWQKVEDPNPSTPEETYYTVYYRPNTTDVVTNMPSDTKVNTKNDVYISSNTPVRTGYKFLGWSTDANSPAPNTAYNGGTLYTDRKDLVLYAIWQKADVPNPNPVLPDNPKTGIEDCLLPFGGAISASGIALNVLKKKKSFKQF